MAKAALVVAEKPKTKSPVDHQIYLKEKLIKRLTKEIAEERKAFYEKCQSIELRIQMAKTLVDALKRGQGADLSVGTKQ